jgi:hypothetical protein
MIAMCDDIRYCPAPVRERIERWPIISLQTTP